MTKNLAEVPPHNRDSEVIVLASIIHDPATVKNVAEHLKPEDFYYKENELIYEAILRLYGETNKIDIALIADKLESMGRLEGVGGVSKLVSIANDDLYITSSHIVKHSKVVKKLSIRRQIIASSSKAISYACDEEQSLPITLGLIDNEMQRINKEYNHSFGKADVDFSSGLEGVLEMRAPGYKGFKTGIPVLDDNTMRLKEGHLWIGYAKSAVGKSTVAVQMAREVLKAGGNVRFLSLEMSSKEIWNKLLQMEEANGLELGQAADTVSAYPGSFYVKDDIFDLYEIQRYVKQHSPVTDVFFIDFLTLIDSKSASGRLLGEIEGIIFNAREVQKIAKMNKACIVVLAQANTDNPRLQNESWSETIKGGNSVKQVADVMFKLSRTIIDQGLPTEEELITVHLQKNKFGRSFKEEQFNIHQRTGGIILPVNDGEE